MKKVVAACVLGLWMAAPEPADAQSGEGSYCWRQYLECLHWASSPEDEYWCDVAYAACEGN